MKLIFVLSIQLLLILPCICSSIPINIKDYEPTRYNPVQDVDLKSINRDKRSLADVEDSSSNSKLSATKSLTLPDAMGYLLKFGYASKNNVTKSDNSTGVNLLSEDAFQEAIADFQRFVGIPETGTLDSVTKEFMVKPRCGNMDRSQHSNANELLRKKRFAHFSSKWQMKKITYRISKYPAKYLRKTHEVDRQIARALAHWSQVVPIEFIPKKTGRVHIDIRFARGDHGDGDTFDGPGGTLAHAFEPAGKGTTHFDDAEQWVINSKYGIDILQVAVHEFGHALGLRHSEVRSAVMAPVYKFKQNFKLHADDVRGLQALYGVKGADENNPKTRSNSEQAEGKEDEADNTSKNKNDKTQLVDLCKDASIDTMTMTPDDKAYVFKGKHYWMVDDEGIVKGTMGEISRDWSGLPNDLDAAFNWHNGKIYFFKGEKFWRFSPNKTRDSGYPRRISDGFPGIPNNVDAAFVWSNGKTYFFKGDKFWMYDYKEEPSVGEQYPRSIDLWEGLPASGIDSAFKWKDGLSYFVKGTEYYRFDDKEAAVISSADPPYPRPNAEWWFGCKNQHDGPEQLVEGEDTNDNPLELIDDSTGDHLNLTDKDFQTVAIKTTSLSKTANKNSTMGNRVHKLLEAETRKDPNTQMPTTTATTTDLTDQISKDIREPRGKSHIDKDTLEPTTSTNGANSRSSSSSLKEVV